MPLVCLFIRGRLPAKSMIKPGRCAGDPVPGGVGLGGGVDVVLLVAGGRRWLHGVGGGALPGALLVPVRCSGGDRGQVVAVPWCCLL